MVNDIETTIEEVEDILFIIEDDLYSKIKTYEFKIEDFDNDIIGTNGILISIPELELNARFGTYYLYNEVDNTYEADFSLTLIYEQGETNPEKYLYLEQDGLVISLCNFLHGYKNIDNIDKISNIPCKIIFELDEEKNIKKKGLADFLRDDQELCEKISYEDYLAKKAVPNNTDEPIDQIYENYKGIILN